MNNWKEGYFCVVYTIRSQSLVKRRQTMVYVILLFTPKKFCGGGEMDFSSHYDPLNIFWSFFFPLDCILLHHNTRAMPAPSTGSKLKK